MSNTEVAPYQWGSTRILPVAEPKKSRTTVRSVLGTFFWFIGLITMLCAPPWGWVGLVCLRNDSSPLKWLGSFIFILLAIALICMVGNELESCAPNHAGRC